MKIQEMEMVLEIIDSGSISAAAKKLFISQPSLSQSIKKIEAELGTPLFIRQSGKVMAPTQAGLAYAQAARQILQIYNELLQTLNQEGQVRKKQIRIGVPSRQGSMIMETLLENQTLAEQMELNFHEGASNELEPLLINGKLDLAVIRLPLKIQNLSYRVVYQEPLGIWLRSGSPWEKQAVLYPGDIYPTLPLEALKNESLILPPSDKRLRSTIDQILSEKNFAPKILSCYQNQRSIVLMVQQGVCSTIGKQPAPGEPKGLFYWIEGCSKTYDLAVVYPTNSRHRQEIRLLEQVLRQHFQ